MITKKRFWSVKVSKWYYLYWFKDDKKNGNGVLKNSLGFSYNGEWKDNKPNGYGIYTCEDKYEGEFQDWRMHGHGSGIFENGCKYIGDGDLGVQKE